MSGQGQLWVQPSTLGVGAANAGSWVRGIPAPGTTHVPAVGGVATCRDLLSMSPPTLLEEYELVALAIGFGVYVTSTGTFASPPQITAELALLVNDRVRYTNAQSLTAIPNGGATSAVASGAWVADLVNAVKLGARDRLSLRLGVLSSEAIGAGSSAFVGIQMDDTSLEQAYESTLSYNVNDLPASRRL